MYAAVLVIVMSPPVPSKQFRLLLRIPLMSEYGYCTNISGYRGRLEDIAPTRVPQLKECLNWNQADEWPHWFERVYPDGLAQPCITTSLFRSEDSVTEISQDLIENLQQEAVGQQTREDTIERMKVHKHRVREHFLVPAAGADRCPFGTLAPLPDDAAEQILGFEAGHTSLRTEGVTTQSRFACRKFLGNSFQCDTVSALLSPLKDAQDRGEIGPINVLSLFDGIGGAAVALLKAGIKVRMYISNDHGTCLVLSYFLCFTCYSRTPIDQFVR